MARFPVCNGFRIRGLNADCDRLALQSNVETTWPLGRGSKARGPKGIWQDVALSHTELKVLRAYGAAPEFELRAEGEPGGVLVMESARRATRQLRVGTRVVIEMQPDESIVLRIPGMMTPLGQLDGPNTAD
jgi:hypothetical protein